MRNAEIETHYTARWFVIHSIRLVLHDVMGETRNTYGRSVKRIQNFTILNRKPRSKCVRKMQDLQEIRHEDVQEFIWLKMQFNGCAL